MSLLNLNELTEEVNRETNIIALLLYRLGFHAYHRGLYGHYYNVLFLVDAYHNEWVAYNVLVLGRRLLLDRSLPHLK